MTWSDRQWICVWKKSDVSRESSYEDDQPEDDTAVPTYHEDDDRNLKCVEVLSKGPERVLQGEVSLLSLMLVYFRH